jgi:hypothetical protein
MTEGKESIKGYNSQPLSYFLRAGLFQRWSVMFCGTGLAHPYLSH